MTRRDSKDKCNEHSERERQIVLFISTTPHLNAIDLARDRTRNLGHRRSGLSANDDSGYNCSANDKSALYRYKTASIDYSRICNRRELAKSHGGWKPILSQKQEDRDITYALFCSVLCIMEQVLFDEILILSVEENPHVYDERIRRIFASYKDNDVSFNALRGATIRLGTRLVRFFYIDKRFHL
ncbi:hypothetical protein ANN_05969 [Periplaneta americana]|uniref:Uncharacterized protein n=1 Tax=Periplaneta americana TaxID=6978 RepID=A0ABQ8TC96_PERAM|nr:hypothetical protein ANN_05969 [Periplaneta americana]